MAFLALLSTGCVKMTAFKGQYIYSVNASDDLLKLFRVDVTYAATDSTTSTLAITSTSWSRTIYKSEDFSEDFVPEMTVTLTAKEGAKSGTLLTKEAYEMTIDYKIEDSKDIKSNGKIVITKADDGEWVAMNFKVPVSAGVNPDNITIEMPPLKYDKHFAFCFRVDDSYVHGWSKLFKAINARWIDNIEYFHLGLSKTTGYQPDYPLCVTDGCGNNRNFTFGEAIWANTWNDYNPAGFIQDDITSVYNPYISWKELNIMTDLGNAVYWHNIDDRKWDISSISNIVQGLKEDYDKTFSKIGYPLKTLAQPDGSNNYLAAAQESPYVFTSSATTVSEAVHFKDCNTLYKKNIFGGDSGATIEQKLEELAAQSASDDPVLLSMLVHSFGEECLDMFRTIYSLYGKAGQDNIWVTSYDELYEYIERKREVKYDSSVADGYKTFTVSFPKEEKFIYDEMSFIVRGAQSAALPVSANIVGFSSALREDGTVLVNCNTSPTLITKIDKYITLYHESLSEEYKLDAEYLISLLKADLREEYTNQLNTVPVDPDKRDLPLNGTYSKRQVKWYIEQYDGQSFHVSLEK